MVPLLARIYPNGSADVNHFHAAGGMGFVIRELLDAGLLHEDVQTVWGSGLSLYAREPTLAADGGVTWTRSAVGERRRSGAARTCGTVPADRRIDACCAATSAAR